MAEDRIQRKELWRQLGSKKRKEDWIRAAKELGFEVDRGRKHYAVIRLPGYEKWDYKGVINNVFDPVRENTCRDIFKKFLDNGKQEDDIWKALRML